MDLFRSAVGSGKRVLANSSCDERNDNDRGGNALGLSTPMVQDVRGTSGDTIAAEDDKGGGGAGLDCELLVAGSYLQAHRVVLARRSPVLRNMIAQVCREAWNLGCLSFEPRSTGVTRSLRALIDSLAPKSSPANFTPMIFGGKRLP